MIAEQPPATIAVGGAFGIRVVAEDPFGNIDPNFDGAVTVALARNLGGSTLSGTTTVSATQGVATFANLSLNNAGNGFTLQVSSTALASATTTVFTIASVTTPTSTPTPSPPTIVDEQVVRKQKTNKKGKAVGKPTFAGFTLQYSTAMNPSTAALAGNYQVSAAITKKVKKKSMTTFQPVNFTAAYTPSDDSVTLTIEGKQTFAKAGRIMVTASAPNGVSSAAGVLLDPTDTVFTILAKAAGITPG